MVELRQTLCTERLDAEPQADLGRRRSSRGDGSPGGGAGEQDLVAADLKLATHRKDTLKRISHQIQGSGDN